MISRDGRYRLERIPLADPRDRYMGRLHVVKVLSDDGHECESVACFYWEVTQAQALDWIEQHLGVARDSVIIDPSSADACAASPEAYRLVGSPMHEQESTS